MAKTGSANGTCANVTAYTNPDADCSAPQQCDGAGSCKSPEGESCSLNSQCISGQCPSQDGVCCDVACSGTCESCAGAKNGGMDGACGFVVAYTDLDNDCPLAGGVCNGAGVCQSDNGTPCVGGGECVSGSCPSPDGVCCNSACGGNCQACTLSRTGSADGTCANISAHTDPDNDCPVAGQSCDGLAGCKNDNGIGCSLGTQCISGNCPMPDAVCCDSACSGQCFGCTLSRTGLASGTCGGNIPGTDPDSECPGMKNCIAGPMCE
jgi:hypothetical protein